MTTWLRFTAHLRGTITRAFVFTSSDPLILIPNKPQSHHQTSFSILSTIQGQEGGSVHSCRNHLNIQNRLLARDRKTHANPWPNTHLSEVSF